MPKILECLPEPATKEFKETLQQIACKCAEIADLRVKTGLTPKEKKEDFIMRCFLYEARLRGY